MKGAKPRLLIIDDDKHIVQAWTLALEDVGFEVISAFSGREGLRTAYEEHPDLILLDIKMPGMDGFEVLDHLRYLTDIPVIMMTAIASDTNQIRSLHKGVADFVPKVAHMNVLIARIQNRLLSHPGMRAKPGPMVVDDRVTIDFQRRLFYFDGREVNLTPLQWKILKCLIEKDGRVASYPELLQAGWDNPEFQDNHLVKVQISLLRAKLKDKASAPRYIHTVREDGYAFEVR